jgi:hypothetical protein
MGGQAGHAGFPRGRDSRHFGGHVIDEEAEHTGLGRNVEKLRRNRQYEVRVRPNGLGNALRGIIQVIIILGFDLGDFGRNRI